MLHMLLPGCAGLLSSQEAETAELETLRSELAATVRKAMAAVQAKEAAEARTAAAEAARHEAEAARNEADRLRREAEVGPSCCHPPCHRSPCNRAPLRPGLHGPHCHATPPWGRWVGRGTQPLRCPSPAVALVFNDGVPFSRPRRPRPRLRWLPRRRSAAAAPRLRA